MADLESISLFTTLFQGLNISLPTNLSHPPSLASLFTTTTALLASINLEKDLNFGDNLHNSPNNGRPELPEIYDFIVVGSGSAGGITASRLSENKQFKVLLLEAGSDPTQLNEIPYLMSHNLGYPETDWQYQIKPQKNSCLALNNNGMIWNRGKSLGGSSNLNFMAYMRGNPNDFDSWAEMSQDLQWTYENLVPFFKKTENYGGNFPENDYHGKDGPIRISSAEVEPLAKEWIKGGLELGYPIKDPNARQTASFASVDWTLKDGKRMEIYEGFIKPALNRSNLIVKRYSHVTKIIVDSKKKATGVNYSRHGKSFIASATKEIILSAGAIGSPQLLLLSGIGNEKHLKEVYIEPVHHLPGVGQNLMDHAGVILGPFLLNESVSFIQDRDLTQEVVKNYVDNRKGLYGSPLVSGVAMINSTNNATDWPNIGMFLFSSGIGRWTADFWQETKNVRPGILQKYLHGYEGRDALTVSINQELPSSRGSITLKSNDPFEPPIIDPNYFSDPVTDLEPMVAAFRFVVKMFEETNTWRKFNATLIPNHFPGCEEHDLKSDEYYSCYIRHFTATNWHYGSTCKMGRVSDPMAVVDSELKVKGISGLRVADASIMPRITNANLNAPTMMIGEKAAHLILKAWSIKE